MGFLFERYFRARWDDNSSHFFEKMASSGSSISEVSVKESQLRSDQKRLSLWNCHRFCLNAFRLPRFKNVEVEILYQRYFLHLNQRNLTALLGIVCAVGGVMLVFNYALSDHKSLTHGITFGVLVTLYLIMAILSIQSFFNQIYLFVFSYTIMISFFITVVLVVIDSPVPSAMSSIWCTVFFVYFGYTLLPVRMPECLICGILLSVVHMISYTIVNDTDPFIWKQVNKLLAEKYFSNYFRLMITRTTGEIKLNPKNYPQ